jgi:hypothetical protein
MTLKRVLIGLFLGVTAIAAALVIAWATGLILHDSSQAASISQALRDFRASGHTGGKLSGVYVYATQGRESIDALGGAHHTYPRETGITVTGVPCGLQLRWAALQGRSTTWTFCHSGSGIALARSDETHSFFGQHDHTVYECSRRILVPGDTKANDSRSFECHSGQNIESGEARILGRRLLEVGGSPVPAVHARTTLQIHGHDSGTETIDWWLDARTSIPLRIELRSRTSRPMFIGTVHYREDFRLRLLSLVPKR